VRDAVRRIVLTTSVPVLTLSVHLLPCFRATSATYTALSNYMLNLPCTRLLQPRQRGINYLLKTFSSQIQNPPACSKNIMFSDQSWSNFLLRSSVEYETATRWADLLKARFVSWFISPELCQNGTNQCSLLLVRQVTSLHALVAYWAVQRSFHGRLIRVPCTRVSLPQHPAYCQ
jgi:hypothetical protein